MMTRPRIVAGTFNKPLWKWFCLQLSCLVLLLSNTNTAFAVERVTQSLIALYIFNEGEGSIVHDVSDFGSALDLNDQ